ncbi:integrase_H2C2 domain-containing protein [Trichonephila clavata]|uniref:Integrase_H2C2 domain-containing protein n=1 Tax=Trichonephila clavata TaxID=2740835 RepID=A0A8X6HH73_TRICU|nr:integrase_H2C2 domain-containing protein [Trichonephila clavata]
MIITNVKADSKDKLPLDRLYDKIEAHLRVLEYLGSKSKVESCHTEDVLKVWQRSSLSGQPDENDQSRVTNLMKFLKAEERLKLARGGLDSINRKEDYHDKARGVADSKFKFKKKASVPTATSFLVTKDHACIFCGKMHESKNYYTARELSVDERISKVKEKKCLKPNNIAKFCKQFVRCFACDQDVISGDIPQVSKGSILKELKRNNIRLSDMGADCPKIDILIGSDNYGKILTGRAIGILDANLNLTNAAEEEIACDQFSSSLTRKENGRYCVGVNFVKCSTKLFADAKMDLRMWTSGPVGEEVRSTLECLNAESTLENIVPVLGIMWDRKDDTLYVESKTVLISKNVSKRVLSLTQAMFDPLGFLAPVLLTAKFLLQEMWSGLGYSIA